MRKRKINKLQRECEMIAEFERVHDYKYGAISQALAILKEIVDNVDKKTGRIPHHCHDYIDEKMTSIKMLYDGSRE